MTVYIPGYCTDIGIKRKVNQDSLAFRVAETEYGQIAMFVLADGMGGIDAGEEASRQVVQYFAAWFEKRLPNLFYDDPQCTFMQNQLEEMIERLNDSLVDHYEKNGVKLGTTATVLFLIQEKYFLIHVGDSRCYSVSDQEVKQLTIDHSFVAREVREGRMTPEEAAIDRRRNILTECVGVRRKTAYQYQEGDFQKDTGFLLCSDGFWHRITTEEISRVRKEARETKSSERVSSLLKDFVEQVKMRNEKDNISVIYVQTMEESAWV